MMVRTRRAMAMVRLRRNSVMIVGFSTESAAHLFLKNSFNARTMSSAD